VTPSERADFLAWLSRLDLEQLHEIQGHVAGVITFKRGARLRALAPGSPIVFSTEHASMIGDSKMYLGHPRLVGTVVKLLRTSVVVEDNTGQRCRVDVDGILGLHTGGMEYTPLDSAAPVGFSQAPFEAASVSFDEPPGPPETPIYLDDFRPDPDWDPSGA
jgi:hypothetical protein